MKMTLNDRLKAAKDYQVVGNKPAIQRLSFKTLTPLLQRTVVALTIGFASFGVLAHEPSQPNIPETASNQTLRLAVGKLNIIQQGNYQTPRFVETLGTKQQGQQDWLLADGRVNARQLLNTWANHDVTPVQAFELINMLVVTQSPVITVSPQTEKEVQDVSKLTVEIFNIKTGSDAAKFFTKINLEKLAADDVIALVQSVNVHHGDAKTTWEDVEMYWNIMSSDRLDESRSSIDLKNDHQDMDTARKALIQAVKETGLTTLRIPLPNWNDTANLKLMADRLIETNQSIQKVTGWEGGVLGLNQRVDLTIMAPNSISLTYYHRKDNTRVISAWEDLGHEWFHALDYSMRTIPVDAKQYDGASFTGQVRTMGPNSDFEQEWGAILPELKANSKKGGHTWYQEKEALAAQMKAKNHWQGDYLSREFELMAFAWQSNIESKIREQRGASCPDCLDGDLGPTLYEAKAAQPIWDNIMAQVKQVWWKPYGLQAPMQNVPFAAKIEIRRQDQKSSNEKVTRAVQSQRP